MDQDKFTPLLDARDVLDLRTRLDRTRWPGMQLSEREGLPIHLVRQLVSYWQEGYNWGRLQARLSEFPQVRVEARGLRHHALHVRSTDSDALPILLAHGWPSTCFEFDDAARILSESHSGRGFNVVCPSLPGFGFSDKPYSPGWDVARIADAWADVMTALGYDHFLAHGGDWGAAVVTELAIRHPERLLGIHLTTPIVKPTAAEIRTATPAEVRGFKRQRNYEVEGFAYAQVQLTRPQTIGYALEDSPIGLCAWLGEKLHAWAGRDAAGESLLSFDAMLDVISIYWLTRTATSSARLYHESLRMNRTTPVEVPTSCSVFAEEFIRPPRAAVRRRYTNLVAWNEVAIGGHFPAAEVPHEFADEIRACVDLLLRHH